MKNIKPIDRPVFWVGLNSYQGLGLLKTARTKNIENYYIICLEKDSVVDRLRKEKANIFCLEEVAEIKSIPRNTGHLLAHPLTAEYIKKHSQQQIPIVAFFKPSAKIAFLCKKHCWIMAGNDPKLASFFEDKINFFTWGKKNNLPVIPGEIVKPSKEILPRWSFPFVAQLKRGWAGKCSFIIRSENDFLNLIKSGYPKAKITPFIDGQTYTNNGCILAGGKILVGPPGQQISSIPALCKNLLSTTGRQWPANIDEKQKAIIKKTTIRLGELMYQKGYRGFFGTDFIITDEGKIYLLECNPRLTASFVFYSQLEQESGSVPLLWRHLSVFAENESACKDIDSSLELLGSEIIQRNNQKKTIKISADIPSGQYNSDGRKVGDNLSPKKDSLLVICKPSNSIIKEGDELFKIISKKAAVDKNNNLSTDIDSLRQIILSTIEKQ